MTVKLYDNDAYLTQFTASVISCEPFENYYRVILDKTAFFPEEGGQYSDKGFLNNVSVFDVQIEDDKLVHYCSAPVCGIVIGKINWDRRFRNMQNHTGEHIISGLIHSLFGAQNVGFHLGEDDVTCDYDIELTAQQIKQVELEANRAIYNNLSVIGYYPEAEELNSIDYRCKKEITNAVRIVSIDGVDCCACCAPHVKRTGEVGVIKIVSAMRLRGGVRLSIRCGLDAFFDYSVKHDEIKNISSLLASKPEECSKSVEKINDSLKKTVREVNFLKGRIYESQISSIKNVDCGLLLFLPKADNDTLRNIVNFAKDKAGSFCAAFAGDDNTGYSYIIYSDNRDISSMAKDINTALNGRGGGRNPMIQGSVNTNREKIEAYFSDTKKVLLK